MVSYLDQVRSWFTDGLVVWEELDFDVRDSGRASSQLCDLGRLSEPLYTQVSLAV